MEHCNEHCLNLKESKASLGYCDETEFGGQAGRQQGRDTRGFTSQRSSSALSYERVFSRSALALWRHNLVRRFMLLSRACLPPAIDLYFVSAVNSRVSAGTKIGQPVYLVVDKYNCRIEVHVATVFGP